LPTLADRRPQHLGEAADGRSGCYGRSWASSARVSIIPNPSSELGHQSGECAELPACPQKVSLCATTSGVMRAKTLQLMRQRSRRAWHSFKVLARWPNRNAHALEDVLRACVGFGTRATHARLRPMRRCNPPMYSHAMCSPTHKPSPRGGWDLLWVAASVGERFWAWLAWRKLAP
jgi:hypothetical protein